MKRKVDGFICGHIHQPASKNFQGVIYKNTGDWVENCSALTERFAGSLQIMHWTDRETENPITIHDYEKFYGKEQPIHVS